MLLENVCNKGHPVLLLVHISFPLDDTGNKYVSYLCMIGSVYRFPWKIMLIVKGVNLLKAWHSIAYSFLVKSVDVYLPCTCSCIE
jgi:hypothetical protein